MKVIVPEIILPKLEVEVNTKELRQFITGELSQRMQPHLDELTLQVDDRLLKVNGYRYFSKWSYDIHSEYLELKGPEDIKFDSRLHNSLERATEHGYIGSKAFFTLVGMELIKPNTEVKRFVAKDYGVTEEGRRVQDVVYAKGPSCKGRVLTMYIFRRMFHFVTPVANEWLVRQDMIQRRVLGIKLTEKGKLWLEEHALEISVELAKLVERYNNKPDIDTPRSRVFGYGNVLEFLIPYLPKAGLAAYLVHNNYSVRKTAQKRMEELEGGCKKMNTPISQHSRWILDDLKEDVYNLKITKEVEHGTYFPGAGFKEGYVAGFYSGFDECKKLVIELIRKEMEANNV